MGSKSLTALVEQCFSPDGWLVTQGYHHEPEQCRYAVDVARWIKSKGGQIELMEAETGIGKTVGYLIPMLLHLSQSGTRAMIATYTVNLQNQIIKGGDLELALRYLDFCNLPRPRIEQVIGTSHYLNPSRLKEQLNGAEPDQSRAAYLAAAEACIRDDGLVETFLGSCGGLPEGVSVDSIRMQINDNKDCNPAFLDNRAKALEADLVITSHMMAIIDSKYTSILSDANSRQLEHVIFDEADAFEHAADAHSSKKVWPGSLRRLFGILDAVLTSAKRGKAATIVREAEKIEAMIKQMCPERGESVLLEHIPKQASSLTKSSRIICAEAKPIISFLQKRISGLKESEVYALEQVEDIVHFLSEFAPENHPFGSPGFSRSRVKGIPALEVKQAKPAGIINRRLFAGEDRTPVRVLMTSATLSDGADGTFMSIQNSLSASPDRLSRAACYSPQRFGRLSFVLAEPTAPQPFLKAEGDDGEAQISFNNDWIEYVCKMVRQASEGGPALVLASSFDEAARLGKSLGNPNVIVHERGVPLKDCIQRFQKDKGVLITPSAWEGVSIRANKHNKQLFHNLVVTRIPMPPPDPFKETVLAGYRKRFNPSLREDQLNRWLWLLRQDKAIRKLRQGLGRLLRKKTDKGTVWIADSRFPTPLKGGNPTRNYKRAISARFMNDYENSDIFLQDGKRMTIKELTATETDEQPEESFAWL